MARYNLPVDYNNLHWSERRTVREQYVTEQGGNCSHCGANLNREPPKSITGKKIRWSIFPEGFRKYPVHLHHSHDTGLTIGAVHNYCNAVLWVYHGE